MYVIINVHVQIFLHNFYYRVAHKDSSYYIFHRAQHRVSIKYATMIAQYK